MSFIGDKLKVNKGKGGKSSTLTLYYIKNPQTKMEHLIKVQLHKAEKELPASYNEVMSTLSNFVLVADDPKSNLVLSSTVSKFCELNTLSQGVFQCLIVGVRHLRSIPGNTFASSYLDSFVMESINKAHEIIVNEQRSIFAILHKINSTPAVEMEQTQQEIGEVMSYNQHRLYILQQMSADLVFITDLMNQFQTILNYNGELLDQVQTRVLDTSDSVDQGNATLQDAFNLAPIPGEKVAFMVGAAGSAVEVLGHLTVSKCVFGLGLGLSTGAAVGPIVVAFIAPAAVAYGIIALHNAGFINLKKTADDMMN